MKKKKPFYSYRDFLQNRYGRNIYRIPVNLDFSCPNRENGARGCAFCGEQGAMAVHLKCGETLEQQVQRSIDYTRNRYGKDVEFMAYFQAYTSTNAPIEQIRDAFERVLKLANFKAVSVSTRPDCLPNDVMDYFNELTNRYDFWVELGVQTSNDKTLKLINRGHDFACSERAIKSLSQIGVNVVPHVILGLPGETREDFEQTAKLLAKLPIAGIKVHNLHIMKNTELEDWYKNPTSETPEISVLDEHEYGEELMNFIRYIPANIPLLRIGSDTPNNLLIAPIWWMKKGQFLNYIHHQMVQRGIFQGDLTDSQNLPQETYKKVKTDDGSVTFYSSFFKEKFHSNVGAISEAEHKFIKPTNLIERLKTEKVRLLDIGFGLGCNALTAFELAEGKAIEIVSFEFDRQAVSQAITVYPQWTEIYESLLKTGEFVEGNRSIRIIWGDARQNIRQLSKDEKFDVIFHDAFSTQKNTELWTLYFFRQESSLLTENGVIVTYSNATPVRSALRKCGLEVGETEPFGRSKGGTIATFDRSLKVKLSDNDLRILNETTARVPFIDPFGNWSRKRILKHRERVVKKLQTLGIPKQIKLTRVLIISATLYALSIMS